MAAWRSIRASMSGVIERNHARIRPSTFERWGVEHAIAHLGMFEVLAVGIV